MSLPKTVSWGTDQDAGNVFGLRCTPFELALLGELGFRAHARGLNSDAVYDAELLCATTIEEPGFVGAIGIPVDPSVPLVLKLDSPSGTSLLGSAPRKFGTCGHLRVTDVTGLDGRVLEECRAVLKRAVVEVANGRDPSGRLTETLLSFTVRHMSLSDDHGHAAPAVSDPIALQVLRLPLFTTELGLPSTALDLIAAIRVRSPAPVDESWSPDRRRFVERLQFLRDQAIVFDPDEAENPHGRPSDSPYTGAVNELIRRYRPDEDGVPISVRMVQGSSGCFVFMGSRMAQFADDSEGRSLRNVLGPFDPRARWTPQQLVAAALLAYAKVNELLEEVTNEHERTFQQRIMSALMAGELGDGG